MTAFEKWLKKKRLLTEYKSFIPDGYTKLPCGKSMETLRNEFVREMQPLQWKKYVAHAKEKEQKFHSTRNRERKEHNYKKKYQLQKVEALKLLGGKCQRCGYEEYVGALQFHHIDPADKWNKTTSSGVNSDFERFKKDIVAGKLLLLCANCHFEKHGGMW